MAPDPLRTKIVRTFKLHGLSLRSEGSTYLQSLLREADHNEVDEALERIIDTLGKLDLPSPVVDKEVLQGAVDECNEASQPANSSKIFNVINAFDIPRFKYSAERKKYLPEEGKKSLFGAAPDKPALTRNRYTVILQRTQRHDLFSAPVPGSVAPTANYTLQTVEQVLGQQGDCVNTIVLAMLVQIKEGKYYLEDPTAHMLCDLSKAKFHVGMFTEYTFCLAEGLYDDVKGVYVVTGVGLPPPEPAKVTRNYFGSVNFFGGPSQTCVSSVTLLSEIEQEKHDAMFVMVSDVWLDQPHVLDKLKTMFTGYSKAPPFAFIFLGNFSSGYSDLSTANKVKDGFKALSDILSLFPAICQDSHFLFIPGPQDPGPANILPRPPLPASLTEPVTKRLAHAHMCSNPVRVQYCSQEWVLFRENIINKMCRHCIKFPSRTEELHVHLAKTLLSQGHLAPLPLHVMPVYWTHDHALRLYPIPDLILIADKYDAFSVTATDSIILNPGSFPKSGFSFKVYLPAQRRIENCEISN